MWLLDRCLFSVDMACWYGIVSVLHPPIQEEVTIRENIARGPQGRGQYFSVLSLPLGLGGVIRTLCPILISQFQACNKSQYCPGPSVTGPHRKRCLNIYHGLHCIRTDQWKGISILTMVNIEIRTSRTMQGRINKEMKFNISHG